MNQVTTINHPEPLLECEVKWALRSIVTNKASGGDAIPAELFKIPKDDAVIVVHSICQQIWKTQQWPQDWKRSFFIPILKKDSTKECQTIVQLGSFHILVKLCSKSFKLGFSIMLIKKFQMYMLGSEKAQDQRSNCQLSLHHRESKGIPEKHLLLLY